MTSQSWNDRYATGNRLLDEQHESLFAAVADLYDAVGIGSDPAFIGHVLDLFRDHVGEHFRDEEAEMARLGFPGAARHCKAHQTVADAVIGLVGAHHAGETVVYPSVKAVAELLIRHVQTDDLAFVAFLREGGAKAGRTPARKKPAAAKKKPAAVKKPVPKAKAKPKPRSKPSR